MQKHLRQTERHLKERTRGEQRRKYPISELVTVTALTEERGESFIKAAHDFMTVTYLYCFDLNCLEKKKAQKYSHTHTSMYLYFLEQPVDLTRKAPETFLFRLHFKNAKTATSCAFNIFGIIYFTYKIIIKTEICKTGTTVGTTPPKLTH